MEALHYTCMQVVTCEEREYIENLQAVQQGLAGDSVGSLLSAKPGQVCDLHL